MGVVFGPLPPLMFEGGLECASSVMQEGGRAAFKHAREQVVGICFGVNLKRSHCQALLENKLAGRVPYFLSRFCNICKHKYPSGVW
eukprot:1234185-Amphidinium_carterae.1